MNRPARRDDECDEIVVFCAVGFLVFRVLGIVSGLHGCRDSLELERKFSLELEFR